MIKAILFYVFCAVVTFFIVRKYKFNGVLTTVTKNGCVDLDHLVMAILFSIVWPFYWFIELAAWVSRIIVRHYKSKKNG